jgi:7,8-dihydropterin-6-yl-methyl-4-(beta-D-ribofuranosyl)aminobenzene 5'-phosphate synthase
MNVTVLVDNNTYIDQYYQGEPAVSYYIESGDSRVLFDTGYSDVLLTNAKKMHIDLHGLTHIVLSHGHNDHTNGLKWLSEQIHISQVKLIAHPDCFLPKTNETGYIGAPFTEEEMTKLTRYLPCKEPCHLGDGLIYLGEIPRITPFEVPYAIGMEEKNGQWQEDYVQEDSALVYQNKEGIFIITGCSHSGICNIIEYAKKVCHESRILGVLGGFHLFDKDHRLEETIRYLENCRIQALYPCHCVSLTAKAEMMRRLPVTEVGVGLKIIQND